MHTTIEAVQNTYEAWHKANLLAQALSKLHPPETPAVIEAWQREEEALEAYIATSIRFHEQTHNPLG